MWFFVKHKTDYEFHINISLTIIYENSRNNSKLLRLDNAGEYNGSNHISELSSSQTQFAYTDI